MKRLVGPLVLLSCAAPATDAPGTGANPHASVARSAIIGGRPSGEDEDAAVYIETAGTGDTLRCSGRIIAPGLVMTARHCLLKRRTSNVVCNPDGTPVEEGAGTDMNVEALEHITVFIGSHKPGLRGIAVRQVVVDLDYTVCRNDLAFVVLAEAGLDRRTPLRRSPVMVGEKISVTGWGYTSDARDQLPMDRATLDSVPVTEVGPGLIPPGAFATEGNTTCLGDSGAVALIDGAAVGVYSTITSPDECTKTTSKNLFQGSAAQPDLVARAFATIGETPWFIDPADAGADAAAPSEDAGVPDSDGGSSSPPSRLAEEGCSMTQRRGRLSWLVAVLASVALAMCARGRGRAKRATPC